MGIKRIKLINIYNSLKDKPLHEQETDDLASALNQYDGNEPLEIQYHQDHQLYYIDAEDIEAYVHGETVWATDPDRGMDDIEVNRDNSDVTSGASGILEKQNLKRNGDDWDGCYTDREPSGCPEGECCASIGSTSNLGYCTSCDEKPLVRRKHLDDPFIYEKQDGTVGKPGDEVIKIKPEDLLEDFCTEEEIREGTCGYAPDGDIDPYNTDELEPAGDHLFILEDEEELSELKFGCTSNHDCQGGDDDMCCDYNTWSCKPCGMLAPIKKTKNERKNVGRGDKNECEKDSDCSGTYDGLCCHDGACSQCITFEKPPKDSKKLEESVIKRLQKLANIKK